MQVENINPTLWRHKYDRISWAVWNPAWNLEAPTSKLNFNDPPKTSPNEPQIQMRVKRHQSHSLRTHLLKLPATLLGILKHPIPKLNQMTLQTHHPTKLESKCKYVKHFNSHSRGTKLTLTQESLELSQTLLGILEHPKTNLNPNNPPKTSPNENQLKMQVKPHQSHSLPITSNSWMPSRAATYCTEDDSAHEPRRKSLYNYLLYKLKPD